MAKKSILKNPFTIPHIRRQVETALDAFIARNPDVLELGAEESVRLFRQEIHHKLRVYQYLEAFYRAWFEKGGTVSNDKLQLQRQLSPRTAAAFNDMLETLQKYHPLIQKKLAEYKQLFLFVNLSNSEQKPD